MDAKTTYKIDYSDPDTLLRARITSINCSRAALGIIPMDTPGTGDYTKERHEILKDLTKEELLQNIKIRQKTRQNGTQNND